jgi:hypothetical protein
MLISDRMAWLFCEQVGIGFALFEKEAKTLKDLMSKAEKNVAVIWIWSVLQRPMHLRVSPQPGAFGMWFYL